MELAKQLHNILLEHRESYIEEAVEETAATPGQEAVQQTFAVAAAEVPRLQPGYTYTISSHGVLRQSDMRAPLISSNSGGLDNDTSAISNID